MLEIRDLSIHVGSFSLKDVNLVVESGSCHVVLGPTGSGKSLLLETVMGFRKPSKGEILHFGRKITHLPPEKREISYLPQDLALFPNMNVEENILYGIKVRKLSEASHFELFDELTEILGITHLLQRRVDNLSGGEKQRVALARALVTGHRTLLLDEPLSALHESMRRELWELIKALQRRFQLNLLMVTHDVEEAFFLADRVSVIYNGTVLQTSEKKAFTSEIEDVRVAKLIGVRNVFHAVLTHVEGERSSFSCHELGTKIIARTPNEPVVGGEYLLGIHSEDVEILESDHDEKSNVVPIEVVGLHEKIKSTTVEGKTSSGGAIIAEVRTKSVDGLELGQRTFAVFHPDDVLVMRESAAGSNHTSSP